MERLTEVKGKNIARKTKYGDLTCSNYCTNCGSRDGCAHIDSCLRRLAAYEDTSLSPEEVAGLAQAKREGRLVELPCKVGDAVYCIIGGHVYEGHVDCWGIYENNNIIGVRVDGMARSCTWGKSVFLTREEAKAALREAGAK